MAIWKEQIPPKKETAPVAIDLGPKKEVEARID